MNFDFYIKKLALKILLIFIITTSSYSHPHTFIEVEPTIQIKDEKINKLHIKWIMDEMTSMMLIMELDDGNGKFDKNETKYIYENYFLSLENYNFYMQMSSNNKKLSINPKNFNASIKNDRLIYAFDIIEKIDIKDLKIDFFDEDLFVGMMLKKEYIKVNGIKKNSANKIIKEVFGIN